MEVKEFYEKMKDIINERVTIVDGTAQVYSDFMKDSKVYEYLFEYKIKSMYIGNDDNIVIEVN